MGPEMFDITNPSVSNDVIGMSPKLVYWEDHEFRSEECLYGLNK